MFEGASVCPGGSDANCVILFDGTPKSALSSVSSNLHSQYVDEFILGFEQRLDNRWTVGISFKRRDLGRALKDAAIDAAVNKYCDCNGLDCNDPDGFPLFAGFTQYVLINPGSDVNIQLAVSINGEADPRTVTLKAADVGYPKASRKCTAVNLTLDRRFDNVWSLAASYT